MKLEQLLSQIESDAGKLIVMYLRRVGTATVDQIADRLNWSKMKTYNILSSLREMEVVAPLEESPKERYALKRVEL
jgi:Mn-dependent DtxR family transcriptional regulator